MSRGGAFFWVVISAITGGLAFILAVMSEVGQRAEDRVLDATHFTVDPPAPLGLVSPFSLMIALAVICFIALWVHGVKRAFTILLASAVTVLASQLLKERLLDRPMLLEFASHNTFPSGHMTVFAVVVAALIWAVPVTWRVPLAVLSSGLLGIVSWQLLEYGWHRPSDLIGALALTLLAFSLASWVGPRASRRGEPGAVSGTFTRVLGIILTSLGLVVGIGGLLLLALGAMLRSAELMLLSWQIVLVGAGVITARVLARLAP